MSEKKKSLTTPPENLKEAVDWVLCMSGNDVVGVSEGKQAIKKLATKVITLITQLKSDSVVGIRFGNVHGVSVGSLLAGDVNGSGYGAGNYKPIESLGNALRGLVKPPNGIGKQEYEYSYSDQNPSTSVDNDNAAKRFLGFIPLVFFSLGFLFWMCKSGWFKHNFSDGPIKDFLVEMGFTAEQLNEEKKGSDVSGMFSHFYEFRNVDPTPTYPAFLQEVEKEGKKKFKSTPSHVPLYAICLIALTYMKNKSTLTTDRIPQTKKEIIDMLSELREAVKSLDGSNLTKFSNAYLKLNTAITDAMKSTESTSSPAGPIAGTLSTLGLGGGAAAAYFLDLGGAKTLVNGLLRIG
ncbi:variant erythrocyte surface antigen-1 family protein [Babesia caballi]|uniref:Variant erythrocyte surface antigen-1 family protein n=1 Tax=Babesia caballi TaxID=5871 RepID=A0AAV4LXX7_BABCB|nr:variant erythrocyte surface antigen-1 family protein [Babesia caballi]